MDEGVGEGGGWRWGGWLKGEGLGMGNLGGGIGVIMICKGRVGGGYRVARFVWINLLCARQSSIS